VVYVKKKKSMSSYNYSFNYYWILLDCLLKVIPLNYWHRMIWLWRNGSWWLNWRLCSRYNKTIFFQDTTRVFIKDKQGFQWNVRYNAGLWGIFVRMRLGSPCRCNDADRRRFVVPEWLVQETSMLLQLGSSGQKGNCQGRRSKFCDLLYTSVVYMEANKNLIFLCSMRESKYSREYSCDRQNCWLCRVQIFHLYTFGVPCFAFWFWERA
jgi:hypothetical protein